MITRTASSWTDWGAPAVAAAVATVEVVAVRPPGALVALVCEVAACLVLVGRRRRPLLTGLLAAVLTVAPPWFGPELDQLSAPILIVAVLSYSVARWVAGLRGLLVLAVLGLELAGDYLFTDERSHDITDVFFVLALLTPPFVLGKVTRTLAGQRELLERQQELVRREAVRAERDRIARELHDVIAHSVSAMVVQTAAAQDLVRSNPSRAEAILADVAATGRQALSETGQLLHVLRDTEDELGLAPTPGLAQVPALVDRFRRDGLEVRASLDLAAPLPTAVDVSSYRIVQEVLTNALRYSADGAVDLSVSATPYGVRIRASNQASAAGAAPSRGSGLGLLGLAERVALLEGRLTHTLSAGRFEVAADLPVGEAHEVPVDAPVDAPVAAPVDAPVDAPVGPVT